MIEIEIALCAKKRKNKKKSNKFSNNSDANLFLPKILEKEDKARLELMRVRKMSARKQNIGIQDDYLDTDGM
jgi:hypothetical protein